MELTELLPQLAQVTDKLTLIRSMSYTPKGLFNHTAAIYQMLTGYTADKVSPSGQLEPHEEEDVLILDEGNGWFVAVTHEDRALLHGLSGWPR